MSQRKSGYKRKRNDAYYTPAWCTEALLQHINIRPPLTIYEPAAGNGAIVKVLRSFGYTVVASDITKGKDFLARTAPCTAVITNPPYGKSDEFITHALALTEAKGVVAMLLRTDYDHAATRAAMFRRPFAMKVVLRRRIRWFPRSKGSPSYNHAWFVWDWKHKGPPIIRYAP